MKNYAIVYPQDTLDHAVKLINEISKTGGEPGIAIVLGKNKETIGVVTDGDIRGAYCSGLNFKETVSGIIKDNFVYVYDHLSRTEQLNMVLDQVQKFPHLNDPRLSSVIVVDREMRFVEVTNLVALYEMGDISFKTIAVYGLGFVGLTLALTLAEQGFKVVGLEKNNDVIFSLSNGVPHFYESGLEYLLKFCLKSNKITFKNVEEDDYEADIHFISVGTPIKEDETLNYSPLLTVGKAIGNKLKSGDLVICRSTVPVGTTRCKLIPLLEETSGLIAGKGFHIAFAPERTVEGNALHELRTLPQVVGGLTDKCTSLASKLFDRFNTMIVRAPSLEGAEIVKLINNTFRDTVFSFANDVANLCQEYNLNSFDIIKAANEGYPRNPIPLPSPGVGGVCLTKDPILYQTSAKTERASFGKFSRTINNTTLEKIVKRFDKFVENHGMSNLNVMIIGVAFKGVPETSDLRDSPSLFVKDYFTTKGYTITAYDAVVEDKDLLAERITPIELAQGIRDADAIFIMNNHPGNLKVNFYEGLNNGTLAKPKYLFDGWSMFKQHEIESIDNVIYSTLGYETPYGHETH